MKRIHSKRLELLSSAIFTELNEWKIEAVKNGYEIIDLGIGSPDLPPHPNIIATLKEALDDPNAYGYPTSEGSKGFRQAVADWYQYRFEVELNPIDEVLALIGSQDGLAHLALSITDPGDTVIVPNPGYPIYAASLSLAGVKPYFVALKEENNFLPDFSTIPAEVLQKAKFMLLNYPSNPLSAIADLSFYEEWVALAKRHNLLLVHDAAYSEMAFDNFKPPSIFEIPGAKEIAVEVHSLSKSFNMAGCRIAFMVGRSDVLTALKTVKSNIDYGIFLPVQKAGITALREDMKNDRTAAQLYEKRRDLMVEGLEKVSWNVNKPLATMFIWAKIPEGWKSRQISREILLSQGVVVVPGDAFGSEGEGYVRIALVQKEAKIIEATKRIGLFFNGG